MDGEFLLKSVHEEYAKRVTEEQDRQNHRLSALETTVTQIASLTASVKELAVNMAHFSEEQKRQGQKLDEMDERDGNKWRTIVSHVVTSIVSIIVAYIFMKVGM